MAEKSTSLSIVIRTVDQATAKLKAINARLDEATKPTREFGKALGELKEKSGLGNVVEGFKGVGDAVKETLFKFLEIGAVIGETVHLVVELVEHFADLGEKAKRLGVGVDFLAEMRYAAEKTGVPIEALDSSLQTFNENLGQARAGTGRMAKFLGLVSPALLHQVKAAKSNAEAFDLIAGAMAKIEDPAKRAALAQKTLGDSALAPLFAKGPKGIKELRDRYLELAGSQEGATEEAEKSKSAMVDLSAATDGIKAALVKGLSPALTEIVQKLEKWLVGHREDIQQWAKDVGEKLPGAVTKVVDAVKDALKDINKFVDALGGWKIAAIGVAAVMAGPLIASIVSVGIALLTTPVGWITLGIAGLIAVSYVLIERWDDVKDVVYRVGAALMLTPIGWILAGLVLLIKGVGKVIHSWGAIKAFFAELWDSVTSVFQDAWDDIKFIVDKVIAAAKAVGDAVGALGKSNSLEDIQAIVKNKVDISGQANGAVAAPSSRSTSAKVTVDFANAPRGTRVSTAPQSTADVDLSVGYQMLTGAQ